jgi:hypothetical protein
MRKTSRFLTVLLLGLTGLAAWVAQPSQPPRPAGAADPLSSANALRWVQGQPMHWRACLLQH